MFWKFIILLSLSFLLFSCCNGEQLRSDARLCHAKEYNYDQRTGSCYKFHRRVLTWQQADRTCMAEGGHLVIINSDQEAVVLKELYAKHPENEIVSPSFSDFAAIGVYNSGVGGSWITVHGDTLKEAGYEKWHTAQPSNATQPQGEFCGVIFRDNAFLADSYCDLNLPFICEKTLELPMTEDFNSDEDIF